jgi:hypothetical protein
MQARASIIDVMRRWHIKGETWTASRRTDNTKAIRAVGACRLAGRGSIGIGPMWITRVARFNCGLGGLTQVGASVPSTGLQYTWSKELAAIYRQIYSELKELERRGYGASPGNLSVALRAFMATYDRWPNGSDSRLLDLVTALEAVLGTDTEIAFKLAFRTSGLLASSDRERAELLTLIKEFDETRSKLVHGSGLKEKRIRLPRAH